MIAALVLVIAGVADAKAAAAVDYLNDIKPLLTRNCVRCHGSEREEGGMRLDTAESLKLGGDSGSPVRQRHGTSLLVQVVTGTHEDIPRMPYKKTALNKAQTALLEAWVEQGAPSPDTEEPGHYVHWSFVPPERVAPPAVRLADWPQNPIDQFILARLEGEGIKPAPEADRRNLLRRLSLDLIGLPPTPTEIEAFLQDGRPGAYARAVERLLASPHYGERWAGPWLDVARYADSNGYSIDGPRQIWKYRDWVVAALNRDLAYDRFVIAQLAGDLLPEPTREQRVATGFNRNTQFNQEGGIDPEQFRVEAVLDRVNTFGTAFLGLTVGCAQCHDHKFDPISQREYYQLFAFFNNSVPDNKGVMKFPGEFTPGEATVEELKEAEAALNRYLDSQGDAVMAWFSSLSPEAQADLRAKVKVSLDRPWPEQRLVKKRGVYLAFRKDDPEFGTRDRTVTKLGRKVAQPVSTMVMEDLPQPRESFLFIKGDFTRPGEPVTPGTPAVLPPLEAENPNRLDLVRWLVQPEHPLTARVLVNRVWQQYFGRGLVATENDFGVQGTPPTHPELLDWLATEFVASGWSLKALHRLVVTSATYRQSSWTRPDLELVDPTNELLARQSRLRLDAELVRDVGLATSGLLVPTLGGPPVFPPQPEGVMNLGQSKRPWVPSVGPDRYRRGLYTYFWRATPHPALAVFDAADGFSTCTRRLRSNTPLQALTLLNDQQFFEFASALAQRVQDEIEGGPARQLDFAYRLCVARPPTPTERDRLLALFDQPKANRDETWITIARVLLNLDETITRE